MSEERMVNIEAKIAYQEHSLQELNDVIYRQQKQIDQLEQICQQLIERVKSLAETSLTGTPEDEKPPHY